MKHWRQLEKNRKERASTKIHHTQGDTYLSMESDAYCSIQAAAQRHTQSCSTGSLPLDFWRSLSEEQKKLYYSSQRMAATSDRHTTSQWPRGVPPPPLVQQHTKPPGYRTPLPQRRANLLEAVEEPELPQEEVSPDSSDTSPYVPPDIEEQAMFEADNLDDNQRAFIAQVRQINVCRTLDLSMSTERLAMANHSKG